MLDSPQGFQSTHPRGVRLMYLCRSSLLPNFNPRTHVGCDYKNLRYLCNVNISIHAPTWGATDVGECCACAWVFQSTHPRGVRPYSCIVGSQVIHFNPRTHVGCDSTRSKRLRSTSYFNPRTHVGCDSEPLGIIGRSLFQSTHPRGVRLSIKTVCRL